MRSDGVTRSFGRLGGPLVLGVVWSWLALGCNPQASARLCDTGIFCPAGTQCAAIQAVCIVGDCGNGRVDPGEECDDGNVVDGDSCSHQCSVEVCGNGKLDPGELCDVGDTRNGDGCSANCKSVEICGNGITDIKNGVKGVREECDDGNRMSGDGCSADCLSTEVCGNGIPDVNEKCDDGRAPGGCNDDCQGGRGCGDGSIDLDERHIPIEECDDGNHDDDDDCVSSDTMDHPETRCRLARCGDGQVQTKGTRHEDCDPGAGGVALETATCNIDCTAARCGDGKVNPHNTASPATAVGEQCDDGNTDNGDRCDNNCTIPACGNNIIDPGEQCDDGDLEDNDGCDHNCKAPACGNGVINPAAPFNEQCDDGNLVDGDGCDRNCKITRCGNGIQTADEQCDDGNLAPDDGCSPTCRREECGNGILDPHEQCDDGNLVDTDACLSSGTSAETTCKIAACGDGKTQAGHEECDDGAQNGTAGSTCSITCHVVTCGNGVKEQGEECDDGNASDSDDCLSSATSAATSCKRARCGDSKINTLTLNGLPREDCDDGALNGLSGERCSATCRAVACGNGVVDQDETCDDGAGKNGAGKRCNAVCLINVCGDGDPAGGEQCDAGFVDAGGVHPRDGANCDLDCTAPVCGDGHHNADAGEECDDGVNNGTAASTCNAFCKTVACGNGLVDLGEQCDPNTGPTHPDSAQCDGDCTAVVCGDGRTNAAALEVCDEGILNGDPCAYNDPTCARCDSQCHDADFHPGGPFCGDGHKDLGHEVCDSGTRNGTACSYGDLACLSGPTSNICDLACGGFIPNTPTPNGEFCGDNAVQSAFNEQCDPGTGLGSGDSATCDADCSFALCGDGYRNATALEACDDGNASACGQCSATCGAVAVAAQATGSITTVPGAELENNETFTLDDGFHPAVTFEFIKDGTPNPANIVIQLDAGEGDTANSVRELIIAAINNAADLDIDAADGGVATVALINSHASALGNRPSTFTSASPIFAVTDMTGGAAGDCADGVGCTADGDCVSGSCVGRRCVAAPAPPPPASRAIRRAR